MSCILRAFGKEFDVNNYVKNKDFEFTNIYKKGEPRFSSPKLKNKINKYSGVGIKVSFADMNEFKQQLDDALIFFKEHETLIKELVQFKGVESVNLDFGVETKPPFWSSYTIPPELSFIVGKLGVSVCVSTYPNDDENET